MGKRGRFIVDVPSAGGQRVADNPFEMSSAGVVNGRRHTSAFIGF
jgi:hypothetical protein